jgi:FkbM family methyltransferase
MRSFGEIRTKIVGTAFPRLFRPDSLRDDLVRVGSPYGGWWVPSSYFNNESVCYCAGVGKDITFDLGLNERFGCRVWGIDPTPESVEWVRGLHLDEAAFTLVPSALARNTGQTRFYKPRNPNFISHSMTNLQRTAEWITVPCITVAELMRVNGHVALTLLKLDIEGAQHDVLASVIEHDIRPEVLCVEFDQPESLRRTRAAVSMLRAKGYALVKVEWLNLTFVAT